nr:nitrate regulatory protein [Ramlibacter albus]
MAARQCEIAELEQLAQSSVLVTVIARFIHALQRERGMSNIYLSSGGARFSQQRAEQVAASTHAELAVRAEFEKLDTEGFRVRNGARLFSRVAVVVHACDGLPALRARVANHALSAEEAANAFAKLISGLLAVVYEAADAATDPEISRALVALFNFMQGKEYAGQERALGARAFASGAIEPGTVQQWRHLVESQDANFQAFADFSDPQVLRVHQASRSVAVLEELDKLRGIARAGGVLDTELTQHWYETASQRIDAMKVVEDFLTAHLRSLCESRIAQARTELHDQRAQLHELAARAPQPDAAGTTPYGPQLERSILAMVQEQARRLQAMGDELESVRATLNERKVVERAKGLLMAHRGLSEDEAYKALRQMAMNQNKRLVDVANAVLSLADVLPGGAR